MTDEEGIIPNTFLLRACSLLWFISMKPGRQKVLRVAIQKELSKPFRPTSCHRVKAQTALAMGSGCIHLFTRLPKSEVPLADFWAPLLPEAGDFVPWRGCGDLTRELGFDCVNMACSLGTSVDKDELPAEFS